MVQQMIRSVILAENLPFGFFPDVSTSYGLTYMAQSGFADKVTFRVQGSLNQDVTIQVVASDSDTPRDLNQLLTVGAGVTLPDGSTATQTIGMTVNLEDNWWPWVGLILTTGATAPTAGQLLSALAILRPSTQEFLAESLRRQEEILTEIRGGGGIPGPGSQSLPPGFTYTEPFFGR